MRAHHLSWIAVGIAACASPPATDDALAHRAYVVSRDSGDLAVIDLDRMERSS